MNKRDIKRKWEFVSRNIFLGIAGIVVAFLAGSLATSFGIITLPFSAEEEQREKVSSESTLERLTQTVIPQSGYTVPLAWESTGIDLVAAGGIDLNKYSQNYSEEKWRNLLSYLTHSNKSDITITQDNAYFWVNTLWALGLTQKSDVLDNGIMGTQYRDRVGSFASTGGWTFGAKDAVSLYSSAHVIPLTSQQQKQVSDITAHIYRPCCGNPTSFPDCNHGMAILGLVELMVHQGFSDEEIYDAALAFNSYWFPQTYIDLAYYFETVHQTPWEDVDAKLALSQDYSSAAGYQNIKSQIGTIPGQGLRGGSCGA